VEEKIKIVQRVSKNAVSILVDEISKIQSLAGSSMSILCMGWVLSKG
jgi:hypothetical protein